MTDDKKKPLDIIRIETEPPDYQAVVVRGVGYFRMPSEETMTDDPHPASAAWQDVEQVLQQEPDLHVLKILIADAKAADAARIAALEQQLTAPTTAAWQDVVTALDALFDDYERLCGDGLTEANQPAVYRAAKRQVALLVLMQAADAQQIAALRDHVDRLITSVDTLEDRIGTMQVERVELEVQIAALRAENEQIQKDRQQLIQMVTQAQQLNIELERRIGLAGEVIREVNHADVAVRLRADAAEAQLTALQAEQAQWQTWGIIEIAVRNVNVASYMNHWEGRALKAEAALAALTAQQDKPVE